MASKKYPSFNEKKATQLAAYLLSKTDGTPYPHISIIKLIYLIDRAALDRRGMAVSTDVYYCLPHGPVVSNIMNLAKGTVSIYGEGSWSDYIRPKGRYYLELIEPAPTDELSAFEIEIADEIFAEHGNKDWRDLRDETHDLPEYKDPTKDQYGILSRYLSIKDILHALGKSREEINQAERRIEGQTILESLK